MSTLVCSDRVLSADFLQERSRVRPEESWVGVEDVAAHLGVGKDSVYRWVESRGLPARKVGRLLRFKLSEVDAWVEAGGGEGTQPRRGRDPHRRKGKKR